MESATWITQRAKGKKTGLASFENLVLALAFVYACTVIHNTHIFFWCVNLNLVSLPNQNMAEHGSVCSMFCITTWQPTFVLQSWKACGWPMAGISSRRWGNEGIVDLGCPATNVNHTDPLPTHYKQDHPLPCTHSTLTQGMCPFKPYVRVETLEKKRSCFGVCHRPSPPPPPSKGSSNKLGWCWLGQHWKDNAPHGRWKHSWNTSWVEKYFT